MTGSEIGSSDGGSELPTTLESMSIEARALLASLPFQMLENWQIPAQYERSVKFSRDGIFANRYLLMLLQADVPLWQVATELNRLQMPPQMLSGFVDVFPQASKWIIGFEEGSQRSTYRAYVEFDSPAKDVSEMTPQPREQIHNPQSYMSHLGFKWDAVTGVASETSQYWYVPTSTMDELNEVIGRAVAKASKTISTVVDGVMKLMNGSATRVKLLVTRDDSGRRISFDLNLYELEMCVGDIIPLLKMAASDWELNREEFQRFESLCHGCCLGHVSFGTSVSQDDFITVYFEPAPAY